VGMCVWGGSPCTAVTPTCTDKEAASNGVGLTHNWGSSPTHTHVPRTALDQQVHSKVSLRRAVDAVQRCGVACVRTGVKGRESGTISASSRSRAAEWERSKSTSSSKASRPQISSRYVSPMSTASWFDTRRCPPSP
jgi:hypothetical protein